MKHSTLLFFVALALILAACGPAPTPAPTAAPPTAAPKPTELKPATTPATALPDLKGRALKVGSDTAYPPFEFINEKKEIVGFDVDLVNEICKRINCKATFITADFDGLLIAVSNKTYDLSASGWTITEERAKTVDFGLPYMKNTQVLLVRSDETLIKDIADLKKPEALVAVQIGTTNAITAKKLVADPNKQVKEFQDFPAAVQALLNKQANVVVIDTFAAAELLEQNKGRIKITGSQFGDEYLGLVFRKGDTELKTAFDAGLKAVFADGTWSKLCEKWWKDISPKPDCTGAGLPLK